jgi:catechol 2,3-dioxygenase-like lactoylglutathione lyase family enzyme
MTCNRRHDAGKWVLLLLAACVLNGCGGDGSNRSVVPDEARPQPLPFKLRFEHIAVNANNPREMADWYCHHLGLKVIRERPSDGYLYIGDTQGHFMLELYASVGLPGPSYSSLTHRASHICFMTDNVRLVRQRLIDAGARSLGAVQTNAEGDLIAKLRDPWGNPIQFVERMIKLVEN